MDSNGDGPNEGPLGDLLPPPKRRKVRKGTKSCWECKRRKIRCIFDEAGSATSCQECRQRGATCVSQENPEQCHAYDTKAADADERLIRVERLAERILDKLDAPSTWKATSAPETSGSVLRELRPSDEHDKSSVSQLAGEFRPEYQLKVARPC